MCKILVCFGVLVRLSVPGAWRLGRLKAMAKSMKDLVGDPLDEFAKKFTEEFVKLGIRPSICVFGNRAACSDNLTPLLSGPACTCEPTSLMGAPCPNWCSWGPVRLLPPGVERPEFGRSCNRLQKIWSVRRIPVMRFKVDSGRA